MVGVLIVGFVANLLIRPVAERYHERKEEPTEQAADRKSRFTHQPEEARR